MKKLSELKPEEKRILAAEACGWQDCERMHAEFRNFDMLPDYGNDLNAMHEAEKTLSADEWTKYDSLMPLRDPQKIHATAAQRLDAFLLAKNLCE